VTVPTVICADQVIAQPWRNGGGRTRELLTRPAGGRDWQLRISLAEVDREGPFSSFPGIERWFAVVAGTGVRLSIDGRERVLRPGDGPIRFSGEAPVSCALLDGATTDLNLMHSVGTGCMQLARPGVTWQSPMPNRGLFTWAGGRLQIGGSPALSLPPRTLLWLDEAGSAGWTFQIEAAGAAAPAFWLGFDTAS